MNLGLRIKLSLMMAFQYAVWGIWVLMIAQRVKEVGLEPQLGWILMTTGLGSILGPIIMGQLADRYFATEKVLAFAHIAGGLVLIATAYAESFWPFFLLMLVYCHLYFPTVGLTNSLAFRALGEGNQNQFPMIRFFGTIGWVAGTWALAAYLNSGDSGALKPLFDFVGKPGNKDILRFPGLVSIVYGLFCFTLPHTPPAPADSSDSVEKKSAFVESLGLLKVPAFSILLAVAGLYGVLLYFYFQNENLFLSHFSEANPKSIGAYQTMGNVFEIVSMIVIPLAMTKLGTKRTMLIGATAYVVMFGLKMIGQPWALMLASNLLHGVCFGLFFVVSQMFVDKAASGDIKASAQGLMVFVVYGVANLVGNYLGGEVRTRFTVTGAAGKVLEQNWTAIWAVPFILALISTLAFALLFKEAEIKKTHEPAQASGA